MLGLGVGSLDTQLKMMSGNIFNMILFDKFKTGDPIVDAIITTIVLTTITYLFQYVNAKLLNIMDCAKEFNYDLKSWVYNKNIVKYEGKIASATNFYDSKLNQSSAFSDRFKALWKYIIDNVADNETVRIIKEYSFDTPSSHSIKRDFGIYMVVQKEQFLISKQYEIYAITSIDSEGGESDDNKNSKPSSKIEKITIELFSYKSDVNIIKQFVDKITSTYLLSIEDLREDSRFIYTLTKNKYEESKCELWEETLFESTRKFSNLFFKNKTEVIEKLDFFLNNKKWYFDIGIPYSIGIGMYGPPGTGKTSLIKAIANYTNRHIVVISLKLVKSKKQLDSIFFEDRYNLDNKRSSVGFDKKIIIFEDIDCIGDIVMDREKKKVRSITRLGTKLALNGQTTESNINIGYLLETIVATEKATDKICAFPKIEIGEEPITLDDILNLWDGIRETPGRIMIISSNHYHDLDPALIRPGRIDLTLELTYTTHETIKEIYKHLFNEDLTNNELKNVESDFYSPAEIINIYMNEKRDKTRFIERLSQNKHV